MAMLEAGGVRLHYELEGDGYPVLLIAPGGMRSANERWDPAPWNPRSALPDRHQLVCMDQRNAGASVAPVSAADTWATYTHDQLMLLDHLGIETCHVIGMCIGGPYILGLLTTAPDRFRSAVLLQPVGVDGNEGILREMFDGWATELAPQHPEADPAAWTSFGDNMWNRDFVLTATREQIASCETPMLVLMGNDPYHPQSVSRELAALAPNATLVEDWKTEGALPRTDSTIKRFLADHTP